MIEGKNILYNPIDNNVKMIYNFIYANHTERQK